MIAFLDTCIHVEMLRGALPLERVLAHVDGGPIRLSPVVACELLRGASGRAARAVERIVDQLVPIEPPSWRACWLEAGRLVGRIFRTHEEIGLARLQNDVILALTARHTGVPLVTLDRHFVSIRRRVPFDLVLIGS